MAKKSKFFTLPKSLTTVTPFTRALALSMLIVLPILAFCFGMLFERTRIQMHYYMRRQQIPPQSY